MTNTTTNNNITQKDLIKAGFTRVKEEDRSCSGAVHAMNFKAYKANGSNILLFSYLTKEGTDEKPRNKFYISYSFNFVDASKEVENSEEYKKLQRKVSDRENFKTNDLKDAFKELSDINLLQF